VIAANLRRLFNFVQPRNLVISKSLHSIPEFEISSILDQSVVCDRLSKEGNMKASVTLTRVALGVSLTTGLIGTLPAGTVAYAGSATAPPAIVAKAPICNPSNHPKIVKVTPDTVKPGDKVTIKGNHFGTKECFHNVSFGSSSTTFKYVNETTLEATVPSLKAGITPINVLTEGGSSQSVVLVNAK
jgi:hypothetical protein